MGSTCFTNRGIAHKPCLAGIAELSNCVIWVILFPTMHHYLHELSISRQSFASSQNTDSVEDWSAGAAASCIEPIPGWIDAVRAMTFSEPHSAWISG